MDDPSYPECCSWAQAKSRSHLIRLPYEQINPLEDANGRVCLLAAVPDVFQEYQYNIYTMYLQNNENERTYFYEKINLWCTKGKKPQQRCREKERKDERMECE